jgi:hypothetical protein
MRGFLVTNCCKIKNKGTGKCRKIVGERVNILYILKLSELLLSLPIKIDNSNYRVNTSE